MVTYSPNGPFVPRTPSAFIPRNPQNFGPRTPRTTTNVGRDVTVSPNGEFIPRTPTEFIPKNAQNFVGGQAATGAMAQNFGNVDAAERNRLIQNALLGFQGGQADVQQDGGTGGGMGANPINALFAPMFANLRQQRQQANKRYEANKDQVTNIYGQITTARGEDVGALETAFKRLVDAASTRSTAVNAQIDTAEAQRLAGNQAALQSMGLEGLSTSQGDVASQGAALAQQTNTLNAENWRNLLEASGRNAQDIARADVAGFNYAMMEDLGQLRGAREEFVQDLGQQRFELKSKKAQATFEYQQAQQRAAAAAEAAKQRAKADARDFAAKQEADALKSSGPVMRIVDAYQRRGVLPTAESATKVINTVNEWFANVASTSNPPGALKWNASAAKASLLSIAASSLTPGEQSAILAIFDEMDW